MIKKICHHNVAGNSWSSMSCAEILADPSRPFDDAG